MLTIIVGAVEQFDEASQSFIAPADNVTLVMQHSLVSLSKWEQIWEKPFLGPAPLSDEEVKSYIECMCESKIAPEVFSRLSQKNIDDVNAYISRKMTATTFAETPSRNMDVQVITAEIIYYWMVALTIPFECQHWHLNTLLALIQTCNEKNKASEPAKPLTKDDLSARRALNAKRKAELKTKG